MVVSGGTRLKTFPGQSAVSFLSLVFLLLHPLSAFCQTTGEEATVLRAARLLDVRTGEVMTPGVIVVEGQSIISLGDDTIPAGAHVVELGNTTLLPGLMDMHTHLNLDMLDGWEARPATETPELNALRGVPYARPRSTLASPQCAISERPSGSPT